ncbi:MAG: single-stranded DNA-binding protein [Christensenellaceae bacterium]|nr:single-stranded DNA-binding protein [Christensenellaceae bacterium]MDD6926609.1 single-stranded DNA-binding protein [bacterium]MDY2850927.1 single-stranded DNA-binding protein [Christensenellaceae bacterium]
MNKVYLIGNLTRDPESTETSSGVHVCRFAVAVNRNYTGADGNRETDFFNITVWRQLADTCGKYLKKGNKVAVVGQLQNRSYEDKDGVKRTVTDIVASEIEFLTPKNAADSFDDDEAVVSRPQRREKPVLEEVDDDQLPF